MSLSAVLEQVKQSPDARRGVPDVLAALQEVLQPGYDEKNDNIVQELLDKNNQLAAKDALLAAKDKELADKDKVLAIKEQELTCLRRTLQDVKVEQCVRDTSIGALLDENKKQKQLIDTQGEWIRGLMMASGLSIKIEDSCGYKEVSYDEHGMLRIEYEERRRSSSSRRRLHGRLK